jgi:hypothetical protein
MTKVEVNPGICGLNAIITADSEDGVEAKVTCETKCAAVTKMFEALGEEVDAYKAVFCKVGEGPVYEAAKFCAHAACPVPAGLLKCIEAECELALPKDSTISFIK